jgi:ribosomal protein S3AE
MSRSEAYRALEWGTEVRRASPEPIDDDPMVRRLMRALTDPQIKASDKIQIRRMLNAILTEYGIKE